MRTYRPYCRDIYIDALDINQNLFDKKQKIAVLVNYLSAAKGFCAVPNAYSL